MKGTVQVKNGYLYAVIGYKDDFGNTKYKWIATGLKERGNRKKAKKILDIELDKFENQQKAVQDKRTLRFKPKTVDPSSATMLFSDYCDQYVDSIRKNLSPTVYDTYKYHYIKIFKEYFDKRKLRLIDITEEELLGFYEERRANGLKNLTLKHYNCVLRPALRKDLHDKLIPENPFDFLPAMKREKPKISFYDKNEMQKLFEVFRGHKLEIPFMLAGQTSNDNVTDVDFEEVKFWDYAGVL